MLRADARGALCRKCYPKAGAARRKLPGAFSRQCPTCQATITHQTEKNMLRARNRGALCSKCAREKTKETTNSESHRKLKSEQTKALWADKTTIFNSDVYRDKLSNAQVNAWKQDDVRVARSCGIREAWKENYDEHCEAIRRGNTPEVKARRGKSIHETLIQHPEIGQERGRVTAERWKTDEAYRSACLVGILSPHKGNVSKGELALVSTLEKLGFKHNVRMNGYVLDFYNESTNTAIEYFGDYWHCHERYHKRFDECYGGMHPHKKRPYRDLIEYDRIKLATLSEIMTVHVIWESDIKMSGIDAVIERILHPVQG